jgi:hypothetical protein
MKPGWVPLVRNAGHSFKCQLLDYWLLGSKVIVRVERLRRAGGAPTIDTLAISSREDRPGEQGLERLVREYCDQRSINSAHDLRKKPDDYERRNEHPKVFVVDAVPDRQSVCTIVRSIMLDDEARLLYLIRPVHSFGSRRHIAPRRVITRNPSAIFLDRIHALAANLAGLRLDLRLEGEKLLRLPAEIARA